MFIRTQRSDLGSNRAAPKNASLQRKISMGKTAVTDGVVSYLCIGQAGREAGRAVLYAGVLDAL